SAFPLVPAGRIPMNHSVTLSTTGLTAADVLPVARRGARVELDPAARERVAAVRAHADALACGATPVYGVPPGLGPLAPTAIPTATPQARQRSLRRPPAAGSGPEVATEAVRGLMLPRARTLASGRSCVRPGVRETLLALLNSGITPMVHGHG